MAQPPRQPQNNQQSDQSDLESRILGTFDEGEDDADVLANEPDDDTIEVNEDNDYDDQDDDIEGDRADEDVEDLEEPPQKRPTAPVEKKVNERNEKFQFREDRAGNFVDEDGNILVRAGKSRDVFVKIKKAYLNEQRKVAEITQTFNDTVVAGRELFKKYTDLKAQKSLAEDRGLTPEETQVAVDLAALNKIDPKAAVRKILTIAHGNGIDLSDLGVTGPLDAAEVAKQAVAKYVTEHAPKPKTAEELAQEEADTFLRVFPEARNHVGVLAEARQKYPSMNYFQIWFEILLHAKQPKPPQQPQRQQDDVKPGHVVPRNASRSSTPSVVNGRLSLKAVDPSKSVHEIGQDLLRDIRSLEQR